MDLLLSTAISTMRHRILLAASLLYLSAANIVWIAMDSRPPFWDMANHASWAIGVLRHFQQNGVAAMFSLPHDFGAYPPLYYFVTALFYRLFGTSIDTAQLANIPAIILLAIATYGIARTLMSPRTAALAGILVNFFPFMLWISREALIEYWLVALVALSIWALTKTKEFSDPKWTLLFGVLCGLGMLTKWTFPLFVAPPALWAARRNWTNAFKAAALAAVLAAYWYVPQFPMISKAWQQAAIGGQSEHDPTSLSVEGWLFYIRGLEGYQLFLPLFVVFGVGLFSVLRNRASRAKWMLIAVYLLGGWCGLMLLPNKDPRYSAPLLPAVAVITAAAFERKERTAESAPVPSRDGILLASAVVFLLFQHVLVSFGISQLPERVVLAKGPPGPVPYDWNLYTQTYFGLWGKPEVQDWQIERVVATISRDVPPRGRPLRLGLIPDLPRFDLQAFYFYIALNNSPVVINRVFDTNEAALFENDYILMSLGDQAVIGSPPLHAHAINAFVLTHSERFRMIDTFSLPNGQTIRLYQHVRDRS
jgi:4-amino-4-deoxy-L-arabinose transferase-like glycosyltransferase